MKEKNMSRSVDQIKHAEINTMFATGVGIYSRVHPLSNEEINFIKGAALTNNSGNFIGEDYNIFNRPELKSIGEFCLQSVNEYYNGLLNHSNELEITISWINKTEPGQYHHHHRHPNSVMSGVFYIDSTKDCPLVLTNPDMTQRPYDSVVKDDNYNIFNSGDFLQDANPNQCLIFPSYIWHSVSKNKTQTPRYSIAFNSFFKGGQFIGASATGLNL